MRHSNTPKKHINSVWRFFKPISFILLFSFLLTSCKKEVQPNNPLGSKLETVGKISEKLPSEIPSPLVAKLGRFGSTTSANQKSGAPTGSNNGLSIPPEYKDMVMRALKLLATTCDDNTKINQWLDQQLADWNITVIRWALNTAMLDIPTYYALFFENSSSNQYFGINGEYTQRLTKTFKDLKRFWNIQSDGIVMVAMHGGVLSDPAKLYKTYVEVYGLDPDDAQYYTNLVSLLLKTYPQYRNGDHPIFSFNSFAQSSFYFPPVGVIPAKIAMGDGIMDGYTAIGYGDVAPQAILAHEFGHQIQFQLGIFGSEDTPEATRRTELMADAYAAYYLSHARGASMQWKRVQQFLQVFFNIGDCQLTSPDHHGTPTQRMAAAYWAYTVANNAQKQGHILSSQEFTALFDAELPKILAN